MDLKNNNIPEGELKQEIVFDQNCNIFDPTKTDENVRDSLLKQNASLKQTLKTIEEFNEIKRENDNMKQRLEKIKARNKKYLSDHLFLMHMLTLHDEKIRQCVAQEPSTMQLLDQAVEEWNLLKAENDELRSFIPGFSRSCGTARNNLLTIKLMKHKCYEEVRLLTLSLLNKEVQLENLERALQEQLKK